MKGRKAACVCAGIWILIFLTSCQAEAEGKEQPAQTLNQAGVVVRLDEESVESRCVEFQGESITGLELITKSGLDVDIRVEGLGSAVCAVEDTGCSADDCFCRCSIGGDCIYWSYWHQEDNGWNYAVSGANSTKIHHGDVDGWSWGPGSASQAIEPPIISFDEICSLETATSDYDVQLLGDSGSGVNLTVASSEITAADSQTSMIGSDR